MGTRKLLLAFVLFTSFCTVGLWSRGVQMGNLEFRRPGEGKIFGRLVESRAHGVFSQAGLLGWVIEPSDMASLPQIPFGRRMHEIKTGQFQAQKFYLGDTSEYRYDAYQSQTGLQAVIYYYLDKIYHDPLILRVACVIFLASVLVYWIAFLKCSFGIWPALVGAVGILSSPFLSETGDNVAHFVGAHYLVLVVMFWAYHKRIAHLATVAFSVVLLKLLLNGSEFLFDVLLLPFVPLVYYAILRQMPWSKIRHDACQLAIGVAAASAVAFSIVVFQIVIVTQSLQAPFAHFVERFQFRIFVTNTYYGGQYHHHSFWDYTRSAILLDKYLGFTALAVGYRGITFIQFIGILTLLSLLAYYLYRLHHHRVILALLVTTWVSILCPLAWIVLAQGHSGSEMGTDRNVWNLPFMFLALALIGVILEQGSQEVRRIINRLHTG